MLTTLLVLSAGVALGVMLMAMLVAGSRAEREGDIVGKASLALPTAALFEEET